MKALHLTFPNLHLVYSWFSRTSKSLHFSYHFPTRVLGNTRFPPYFKIPSLHFTSLHFTSLNTFLSSSLYIFDFHTLQIPFTSLHFPSLSFNSPHFTSLPFTLLHFASLHFTFLQFTSLYFTSHHFTSLHFPSLHFPSIHLTLLPFHSLHFTYHFSAAFPINTQFPPPIQSPSCLYTCYFKTHHKITANFLVSNTFHTLD
jgi:hypothetical protein